jgi:hypothetical protein
MTNYIYAIYSLAAFNVLAAFNDEETANKDTLMGVNYDLETAQQLAKSLPGTIRVYAFIKGESGSLTPHHGLDVTEAGGEPKIYSDELLSSLTATLPLNPNQPAIYTNAPRYMLPLFGFCKGRAVHIKKDLTGYVTQTRPAI